MLKPVILKEKKSKSKITFVEGKKFSTILGYVIHVESLLCNRQVTFAVFIA